LNTSIQLNINYLKNIKYIRIFKNYIYNIRNIFLNNYKNNINFLNIYSNIEYNMLKLNKELYKTWFYSNTLLYRQNFWILVVVFIALGYIGQLEVNTVTIELGQNFTVLYFLIIFMLSITDRIFLIMFSILVILMYLFGLFGKGLFFNIEIEDKKF
jgi:hypothetical protein